MIKRLTEIFIVPALLAGVVLTYMAAFIWAYKVAGSFGVSMLVMMGFIMFCVLVAAGGAAQDEKKLEALAKANRATRAARDRERLAALVEASRED